MIHSVINHKKNIAIIGFSIFLALFAGIAVPVLPRYSLFAAGFVLILSFALIKKELYDLLLCALVVIYLAAQFQNTFIEMLRFIFLFLVVIISLFILKNNRISFNQVISGVGALSVYTVFTSFQSFYPTVSLLKGLSLVLVTVFLILVPVAIQKLYPKRGAVQHVVLLLFILSIITVLTNAFYFFLYPSSSNVRIGGTAFLNDRFRGWFTNPNDLATFLGVFIIPILYYKMRTFQHGYAKAAVFIALIIAIVELALTQSRAGILSCVIALLILILAANKVPTRFLIIILLFVTLFVAVVGNPEFNFVKSFIYRNETKLEGSGRLAYWIGAWNRFLEKPILGSGFGVSNSNVNQSGFVARSMNYSIQKDSSYVAALEELGIIGNVILWFFIIIPVLNTCRKVIFSGKLPLDNPKPLLVGIVLAGLFNAIFETWLLAPGNFTCLFFWLIAYFLLNESPKNPLPPTTLSSVEGIS